MPDGAFAGRPAAVLGPQDPDERRAGGAGRRQRCGRRWYPSAPGSSRWWRWSRLCRGFAVLSSRLARGDGCRGARTPCVAGGPWSHISAVSVPLVGVATFTVGGRRRRRRAGCWSTAAGSGRAGRDPLSLARLAGAATRRARRRDRPARPRRRCGERQVVLVAAGHLARWAADGRNAATEREGELAIGQTLLVALVNFSAGTAGASVVLAVARPPGSVPTWRGPEALLSVSRGAAKESADIYGRRLQRCARGGAGSAC